MSRRASASVLIAMMLPMMGTLTATTSLQSPSQSGTSAGVTCAYLSGPTFGTEVVNVEIDGPSPPPISLGMSCAAATRVLTDLGFAFVETGPRVERDFNGDGTVDAADYVVWRKNFGTNRPRPGTIVITACAHFNGPAISTELVGVEHDGPQPPPVITGKSCAAAFGALIDQDFGLLYEGPTVAPDLDGNGSVDGTDFLAWRRLP